LAHHKKRKSEPSDAGDVSRATVLFVSNDDLLRAKAHAFLESEGILVFSSADVQFTSEVVFCACDVNVLIVDQDSLGARRAMALAGDLSDTSPRSPVIILTGDLTPPEVFQTIRLRGWRALRNPVPLAILHGVIPQMLVAQKRSEFRTAPTEAVRFRISTRCLRAPIRCPLAGRKIIETGAP
jgi:DNA-binding NtrC family response regulator